MIGLCAKHEVAACSGLDLYIIRGSHAAYESVGVPRAKEKGFGFSSGPDARATTDFTAIGTEAHAELGLAGAPLEK